MKPKNTSIYNETKILKEVKELYNANQLAEKQYTIHRLTSERKKTDVSSHKKPLNLHALELI